MTEFEQLMTGGHPNSLGRTLEVVEQVMNNRERFSELIDCYQSGDEVVRLRTSNAVKRVTKEHPEWLLPFMDRFLNEISQIDQASTQWTLANLFDFTSHLLDDDQRSRAQEIMKANLDSHQDWIVINNSMQTLGNWAKDDEELRQWLLPRLERFTGETRKSIAGRAKKLLASL